MKKTSIIIILVALLSITSVFSQKVKYAFIDKDTILINMPEMKLADSELNAFVTELQNEVTLMSNDYNKKVQEYEENKTTWGASVLENRTTEINDLQKRNQEFQIQAQEDIITKKTELYTPVFDKFNKAVEEVAKEGGYDAVFPTMVTLYFDEKYDITDLVRKKLGM